MNFSKSLFNAEALYLTTLCTFVELGHFGRCWDIVGWTMKYLVISFVKFFAFLLCHQKKKLSSLNYWKCLRNRTASMDKLKTPQIEGKSEKLIVITSWWSRIKGQLDVSDGELVPIFSESSTTIKEMFDCQYKWNALLFCIIQAKKFSINCILVFCSSSLPFGWLNNANV